MNRCVVCGYSGCHAAIDYHHLDNGKKEFIISDFLDQRCTDKNKRKLVSELKKCVALCKICHHELHSEFGIFQ